MSTESALKRIALAAMIVCGTCVPLHAQQPVTIRVAAPPIDEAATILYAQDLGYFKDAGLDVQFASGINNASAAVAALTGGSIDVTASAIVAVAAAHSHGINMKIIAPGSVNTPDAMTDVIAVRKDSPIRSGADLNGKTIGIIGLKSEQQVAAMGWVDKHGGDSSTLKFVEAPLPLLCPQLVAGRVDASLPVEPFLSSCKDDVHILGNVEDGIAPNFASIVFVANPAWLSANPGAASRFVAALRKAAVWANSHHAESAAILVRDAKLDPAIAATMARATYSTSIDPASIQPAIDAAAKYGSIEKSFPASELF